MTLCFALAVLCSCAPSQTETTPGDNNGSSQAIEPKAPLVVTEEFEEEIDRLAENPIVQRAMETIAETDEQTVADMITLTEIEAPPFKEDRRGQRYAEMLRELGLSNVSVDEVGNVIGRRPGTIGDRVLALTAHLDTVFPEGTDVQVREEEEKLHAPGIGDDARGLAAVLAVLRAMNAHEIQTKGDVLFVGTVGEEGLGDLRGVKHLFREGGPRIDAFITVDGTGMQGVTHMGLGSHRYRITYRGPGGHSWADFGYANPQHALGAAIKYWVDAADDFTKDGPKTSYNVGRVSGGTSVNSIPFEAVMEVDMRSESDEKLAGIDALLQEALVGALDEQNAVRRDGPELELEVELIGDRPSGEIDVTSPLVQRAIAATQYFDRPASVGRSSTDANVPIAKGIPAISIGGGGVADGYHSLREWYRNEDGHLGIQRALFIVLAQAGLAEP